MNATPLLSLRGISKTYPGVVALSGIDFDLQAGEVHGLVGENGAGKTTLLKIIGGAERADAGVIELQGRRVALASPREAQALGIRSIHQEFNLFPALTVAENICLDHLPTRVGLLDGRSVRAQAREAIGKLGVQLLLDTPVRQLNVADQQLVEIARALSAEARVLIMDEPTSALTEREIEALFAVVRSLRDHGVGVVFVSHRMEEVLELSDRVTVLRDGRLVGETSTHDRGEVIRMMVGRQLDDLYPKANVQIGPETLSVHGLTSAGRFTDVTFCLHRGEILGIAGVIGSGRTSIGKALFGMVPINRGTVAVDQRPVHIRSPRDALRVGIGYLPEDRKTLGLVLGLSVRHNETHVILPRISRFGWVDRGRERDIVTRRVQELRIRTPSLDAQALHLSGGNQQKLVLAKWLEIRPAALILDEPTRGVDVGAKAEIYQIMGDLVRGGVGIILISSDLPELLGLADRLVVLRDGRVVTTLDRPDATQERVLHMVTMGAAA